MRPSPSAARALTSRVVPHFQPIVDLASREVVGYEALARWPAVPEARPDEVFAAAAAAGTLTDLDWICRRAAVECAVDARLRRPLSLFVNVEPRALGPMPRWDFPHERFREIASTELQIVVEFTERELLADPAAVMNAIDWARGYGCGIALDDVGVNPESLIVLPIAMPDVVKLDRSVITHPGTRRHDETTSFVTDYAVSTGARVIAEGIESERDAHLATVASATLGQGYLFGAPAPAPSDPLSDASDEPLRLFEGLPPPIGRPSDILGRLTSHVARYETISGVLDELGAIGESIRDPGCLLMSAQDPVAFTRRFGDRWAASARQHELVGVIGAGSPELPGVRGPADTSAGFPGEFSAVVLSAHHAVAVVALDLGDRGPAADRRYAWCLTHDRAFVREVAGCILRRLAPRGAPLAVA
jgi:EAL domain-containing protein (putative c-di-GMP-specific phosphodiesterase class I)